jgi:hypothetical protein
MVMAVLMAVLFLGTNALTHFLAVSAGPDETILSALARRVVGNNVFYYVIQLATLAILTVATNTSFAGFPRLGAILAQDAFLPRQLSSLGDRLGFTNGIALLSAGTAGLIILFGGDTHALVPLFAVARSWHSLFAGRMVVHWIKEGGPASYSKALINGLGAMATASRSWWWPTASLPRCMDHRPAHTLDRNDLQRACALCRGAEPTLLARIAAVPAAGGTRSRSDPDLRGAPRDRERGAVCAIHVPQCNGCICGA